MGFRALGFRGELLKVEGRGWGSGLRVVTWALNMVPYLLSRVLRNGPLICVGYLRG